MPTANEKLNAINYVVNIAGTSEYMDEYDKVERIKEILEE